MNASTHTVLRFCLLALLLPASVLAETAAVPNEPARPFGPDFPDLGSRAATGWDAVTAPARKPAKTNGPRRLPTMHVPRDEVVAFALYTTDGGTLKLTAQLYPLKEGEPREVRLEIQAEDGSWQEAAREQIVYPGWSAHFRIDGWDQTKSVPYRVRHGQSASWEGIIRRDPVDKDEIVVANLGCNSSRSPGGRPEILGNLIEADPDLLFFSGDQTYHHTEHTAGWIEFGLQFRDVIRDRPTVCIPDDHDVGQANLWGEGGVKATSPAGSSGGYFYPPAYVNMVQRQQTWNLPDAYDATPIARGIEVYYTRLRVGGIDFAILEDRKFKTGPEGAIPKMGPRPDHINNPAYDRETVDLEGLVLLGQRQLDFLRDWGQDYEGAEMKCVLSQTAFCGAVHLHGRDNNRLLADLDSNAWPQSGRNQALREIRRAWAPHLCGDQHLAVSVRHGIDGFRDGPFAFTAPALVNTIYGRWWHPLEEELGNNPIPGTPLPWTGDFFDGLGNRVTMLAYANPADRSRERFRADGYGIVRFRKSDRSVSFEAYKRFSDLPNKAPEMFPGWPITFRAEANDGRKVAGHLPALVLRNRVNAVVQVINEADGEILYTVRTQGQRFRPRVYDADSTYTIRLGDPRPDALELKAITIGNGEIELSP